MAKGRNAMGTHFYALAAVTTNRNQARRRWSGSIGRAGMIVLLVAWLRAPAMASSIPTLFNTGVATNNPDGTPATLTASGAADPHYSITSAPVNGGGPSAFVTLDDRYPFFNPQAWPSNSALSKWLSPRADEGSSNPDGTSCGRFVRSAREQFAN